MDLQSVVLFCCVYLTLPSPGSCFNHWVVTEDGKIEYQAASPFNLRHSFDLMALIQQERRVSLLKELKEELIDYKQEFEFYSGFDTFDESYRASDPECRNIKFISSYDLTISTVLPLKHKNIDFLDHLVPLVKPPPAEPHCTDFPLDFSMLAMEHLEGMQGRRGLMAPPEKSVLSEVEMRLEMLGSLVHHALNKNSSSWVLLNLASLYWRARGNPYHTMECIRRALHYSPRSSMDIALLNLANVLHRSRRSSDALVALQVAVSVSPSISVLHYAMGNIYASLEQLNNSADCYRRCVELDSTGTAVCREMYVAAVCELRMEQASKARGEKLDETQKKLDMFYANMDLVRQQQAMASVPTTPGPNVGKGLDQDKTGRGSGSGGVGQGSKVKASRINERRIQEEEGVAGKEAENKSDPSSEMDLEKALDQALNESDVGKVGQRNKSGECDKQNSEKRSCSSIRLVLKPLPPEELEDKAQLGSNGRPEKSDPDQHHDGYCFDRRWNLFQYQSPNMQYEEWEGDNEELASNGADSLNEILMLNKIEKDAPPLQPHVDLSKLSPRREYPKDLHRLEFFPYHPLPHVLDEVIFPSVKQPLPLYHDPYWPRKKECLDLVREIRALPGVVKYTGTFITPEARGASINELLKHVSSNLPYKMRRKPDCTKIVELPLSILTMDHLEPLMYRANFRSNLQTGEKALKKVIVALASASLSHELTFEESGERIYAAMMTHGNHWVLFDLASLYWRVRGDPTQSIECLRRAVHFAPPTARDVGYVGLANVLLRQNFLNEAVIMARAALDVGSNSPVAHYTLAQVYLSLHDFVAAALHLRAALQSQPQFSQALTSLRNTRCALKFNEERLYLRQKTKEDEKHALKRQEAEIMDTIKDVVKSGKVERRSQPAMVIENKEPPEIPEMSVGEVAVNSQFTGEDAIKYIVSLALHKYRGKLIRTKENEALEKDVVEDVLDKVEEGRRNFEGGKREDNVDSVVEDIENSHVNEEVTRAVDSGRDTGSESKGVNVKKKKTKKKKKKAKSKRKKTKSRAAEAIRKAKLEELDRETRQIIREAAEALNRNQTPVLRRSSPKVYKLPPDSEEETPHSQEEEGTTASTDSGIKHGSLRARETVDKAKEVSLSEEKKLSVTDDSSGGDSSVKTDNDEQKVDDSSDNKDQGDTTTTMPREGGVAEAGNKEGVASNGGSDSGRRAGQQNHRTRKTRDQIREEESKRRFPERQPWPTLEECDVTSVPKSVVFTSTWLSVTAKGIKVKDYVDFTTPINPHHVQLPYCHNDFEQSEKTLSHLTGMSHHPLIQYKAEKGLQEVLCSLDGMRRPVEEVATRIKLAMDSNTNSWILSNLAALYWRIVGQGQMAIKCLKHALYFSDDGSRDVALVSLSNVLYRSGFDIDAAVVIHMSLELSPTLVVNHFTMANILAAQGLFVEAAGFYDSTLQYQPEFQPAAERLRTVRCLLLFARRNAQQKPSSSS